jgi:hypothetical protein
MAVFGNNSGKGPNFYSELLRAERSRYPIPVEGENFRTVHTLRPTQTPVRAERSIYRIPVGGENFRTVYTDHEAHLDPRTIDTGFISEVKPTERSV